MIQIDLITGFLGSGKTTFIKNYAHYLISQGLKVGIIENDYGAINVDRMLLEEDLKDAQVEMVIGGDKDCRIRRFKTKLISMGMQRFDRVIVEPSGIYDVDEFFDVLNEEPLDQWYEIGNVIAIVNAELEKNLSPESDYVLASEVVYAGRIILSRVQEASKEQIDETIDHLQKAIAAHHSKRDIHSAILAKDWHELTDNDYEVIMHSGYDTGVFVKKFIKEDHFNSLFFLNIHLSIEEFKEKARAIFNDQDLGHVMRVKGFIKEDDGWYEVNATDLKVTVEKISQGQEVIIVIGEELDEKKIADYLK